jgi:Fe-S-cluster-containing dehydrogenase component
MSQVSLVYLLTCFVKQLHRYGKIVGKSLVVGGGHQSTGELGVALEVAVNLLNSALDNDGVTVDGNASTKPVHTSYAELLNLVNEMKSGQVDVLIIYKTNPIYALPKAVGFEEALAKVGQVVMFADRLDETGRLADFVAATPHATEAWGDSSPYSGVYTVQQPTISPLYKTRGLEDSLIVWGKKLGLGGALGAAPNWHEYLMNSWKDMVHSRNSVGTPFQIFWEQVLRDGFYDGTSRMGVSRARTFGASTLRVLPKLSWAQDVTLVMYPKSTVFDGQGAESNNGWLHELPDPVTKVTWDNHASISPAMAKRLGVKEGDVVRLKTSAASIEVPVFVQPGMHDQTVGVQVGYGRTAAGRVGNDLGANVYPLASASARGLAMSGLAVSVEKTGKTVKLATTQRHHSMEGRAIVREAGLSDYQHNSKAGNEHQHKLVSMWPAYEYAGYKWGMAIDLNACTGCSACVIGCQAENNIPVVGKRFVLDSKEMHWLRIDRYYSGNVENPETVHQPMLCQQCENAPCETVCPVLATMHDHEGLNQQVYNRCVGTRYCANNCPYKVRRFNWFTFTDYAKPMNLVFNPDLTVRTRGVMEKCTFCVQRIREAKDRAKDQARKVLDGELKTACQQSCPTNAIFFGDINDKNTRVSQVAADPRGYHVLEELNVRPSVTYLTKIRNAEVEGHGHGEGHGSSQDQKNDAEHKRS